MANARGEVDGDDEFGGVSNISRRKDLSHHQS